MRVLVLIALCVASVTAVPALVKRFPERIVGGVGAARGEFPSIVQIRRGGHYCGGSIVNADWIVTAAHCSTSSASGYSVVAGEHNLNQNEGSEQTKTVQRIVVHPQYNSNTLANDIAVWRMSTPFSMNQYVAVANLPAQGTQPTGTVTAAGWGTLTEGGSLPTTLMKVDVPMVTLAACRQAYGAGQVLNGMICAGISGKDACQGDSGGPLYSAARQMAGITSWGIGCARPNYPGVYTDVGYFRNWIDQTASG